MIKLIDIPKLGAKRPKAQIDFHQKRNIRLSHHRGKSFRYIMKKYKTSFNRIHKILKE